MFLKKASALLCAAMLCISCFSAVAAEETSPVSVNNETREVTIDMTTIQYPGTKVSVSVWKPGCSRADIAAGKKLQDVSAYIGEITVADGGLIQKTFKLDADAVSGTYTLSVFVPGDSEPTDYPFPFSNLVKARGVLAVAQDSSKSAADIKAALDGGVTDVDVSVANDYLAFNTAKRNYVAENIVKNRPTSSGDPNADMADFIDKLRAQNNKIAMTKELAEAERAQMKSLLENNSTLFLIDASLEAYNALSDEQKEKLYSKLSLTVVDCVFPEDVKLCFEEALEKAEEEQEESTDSKPSNGGSSGGGGGRGSSLLVGGTDSLSPAMQVNEAPKSSFKDIENVPWAQNAINILAERGVINGKAENEFCPGDSVKKEEFLKMLISAFNLKASSASALPFEDVKYDDWYYESVHTAYQFAITSGISETLFGTGTNISRQDMAVLIYNTLTANGVIFAENEEMGSFIDGDEIADYAKTAVGILSGRGVINGRDDGSFDPKSTATRAEAAKMLYEVLSRFKLLN